MLGILKAITTTSIILHLTCAEIAGIPEDQPLQFPPAPVADVATDFAIASLRTAKIQVEWLNNIVYSSQLGSAHTVLFQRVIGRIQPVVLTDQSANIPERCRVHIHKTCPPDLIIEY